ncbi:MAG: hypothetical protein AAF371_15585, partial [Pseudomonadota bacterium]
MSAVTSSRTVQRAILCAAVLSILPPVGAGVEDARADTPKRFAHITSAPPRGIDCTFFRSQAFNQADDHFTVQMARMCVMLSRYKTTVIDANSSRFRASRAAEERASAARRVAPIEAAPEASKYLIAREIGLIEALTAPKAP